MAMAADGWIRGLAMLYRWWSGAWQSNALVGAAGAGVAEAAAAEIKEGI